METRIAAWHSLAHIEFVAIDMALDMAGRFGGEMARGSWAISSRKRPTRMHFALVARRLRALGSHYGALPVHNGLWQAAQSTRHDGAARLAVVPVVLEARGLDVTPAMIARIRRQGNEAGATILERIREDAIRHVATGARHFAALCNRRGEHPFRTRAHSGNHWRVGEITGA